MPGATRHFTHTIRPRDPEDLPQVAARAKKILAWACEGDDRVTCHGITGEPLGQVTMNLTIKGRDRWWAMQLAQDIINYVTWGMSQKVDLDLRSLPPPPHMSRGYGFGRTKTWRDPKTHQDEDPL